MTKVLLSLFAVLTAIASPNADTQIGPVELSRLDGSRLTMQNYAEHRATVVLFLSSRSSDTDSARDKIRELNRRRGVMFVGVFPNPAEGGDEVRSYAAISMRKLRNGNIILAWNNQDNARTPLHIARSTDDGKTWSRPLVLESNPGEYSYPSVFQTSDGKVHVIFTYRRYSIKHVEFDESWLDRFERQD